MFAIDFGDDITTLSWFQQADTLERFSAIVIGKAAIEKMKSLPLEKTDLTQNMMDEYTKKVRFEFDEELNSVKTKYEDQVKNLRHAISEHEHQLRVEKSKTENLEINIEKIKGELMNTELRSRQQLVDIARLTAEQTATAVSSQIIPIEREKHQLQNELEMLSRAHNEKLTYVEEVRKENEKLLQQIHENDVRNANGRRKGIAEEDEWEEYLKQCPLLIEYDRVSMTNHSGDHVLKTHHGIQIIWENKHYQAGPTGTVPQREITKLKNDMNSKKIAVGVLVARHLIVGGQRTERFALDNGTPATLYICPNVDVKDENSRSLALSYIHLANIEADRQKHQNANGGQSLLEITEEALSLLKTFKARQLISLKRAKEEVNAQEASLKVYTELENQIYNSAAGHGIYIGNLPPQAEKELRNHYNFTGDLSNGVIMDKFMQQHQLSETQMGERFGDAYVHDLRRKTKDEQIMAIIKEKNKQGTLKKKNGVVYLLRGYTERNAKREREE